MKDIVQQTMAKAEINLLEAPTPIPEDELLAIAWISEAIREFDLDKTMEPAGRLVTGRGRGAGTGAGTDGLVTPAWSSPVVPSRSKILVRRIFTSPFPLPEAYADDDLELLAV